MLILNNFKSDCGVFASPQNTHSCYVLGKSLIFSLKTCGTWQQQKGATFGFSIGRSATLKFSASEGNVLPSRLLTRGSAFGPCWGLRFQNPVIGVRSTIFDLF